MDNSDLQKRPFMTYTCRRCGNQGTVEVDGYYVDDKLPIPTGWQQVQYSTSTTREYRLICHECSKQLQEFMYPGGTLLERAPRKPAGDGV